MDLSGSCHCGAVTVRLRTDRARDALGLRACQCGFCRKHGVRTVSDPRGRLAIEYAGHQQLLRYRFGHAVSDFLVCGGCGVYVAAILEAGSGAVATLNVNVLDGARFETSAVEPVSYDSETPEERRARRLKQWTPTTLTLTSRSRRRR